MFGSLSHALASADGSQSSLEMTILISSHYHAWLPRVDRCLLLFVSPAPFSLTVAPRPPPVPRPDGIDSGPSPGRARIQH